MMKVTQVDPPGFPFSDLALDKLEGMYVMKSKLMATFSLELVDLDLPGGATY